MADISDKIVHDMEIDGVMYQFEQPIDGLTADTIAELMRQNKVLAEAFLQVDAKATDLTLRLNDTMKFVLTDSVELTIFASLAAGMAKYGTNLSTYTRALYAELAEVCQDITREMVKKA